MYEAASNLSGLGDSGGMPIAECRLPIDDEATTEPENRQSKIQHRQSLESARTRFAAYYVPRSRVLIGHVAAAVFIPFREGEHENLNTGRTEPASSQPNQERTPRKKRFIRVCARKVTD